jgi:Ca2+-binding EF-hand superfamily protein
MRAFLLTLPLLAFAAPALAQDGPQQPTYDGIIGAHSQEQVFFSPSGEPFRAKSGEPYPMAKWFAQADTDHDGRISHDEFVADAVNFFEKLDVNHDNYISSVENTRYETEIAPEITRMDPRIQQPRIIKQEIDDHPDQSDSDMPNGGKYIKQILGAAQYGLIDEPQPIRAADSNFDFRVSMDEWLAATEERFKLLDRNGDGYITMDELPTTPFQKAMEVDKGDKGKKKKKGWW